jgi:hypothetical protein
MDHIGHCGLSKGAGTRGDGGQDELLQADWTWLWLRGFGADPRGDSSLQRRLSKTFVFDFVAAKQNQTPGQPATTGETSQKSDERLPPEYEIRQPTAAVSKQTSSE